MSVDPLLDAGAPHLPDPLDPAGIRWEQSLPTTWWRNSHVRAPDPLSFTNTVSRFGEPSSTLKVLYLGSDSVTCFWECGLGRDLNSRMPGDRVITERDLLDRLEWVVNIDTKELKIFNSAGSTALRSIGAKTVACFTADYATARRWAAALVAAGAQGILHPSTRQHSGTCLALFESDATVACLSAPRKVRYSYDNPDLLAHLLLRERVILIDA